MGNARDAPTSLAAGQLIGGCRIERFVGRGGMGQVYLARHLALEKPVAVKILPPTLATEPHIDRFFTEARMASRIEHPNVVTIYDVGRQGEFCYMLMQFVVGRNLAELVQLQGAPLPWLYAVKLGYFAAKGLHAVHEKHLIHRDVKPSNIMLSHESRVILMDFGLVREEVSEGITQLGEVVGTPAFMSPEQCRAERLDRRSDIFSLGSTLYFLLSGEAPFQGGKHELIARIGNGKRPEPLYQKNPAVPRDVSELIVQAMAFPRQQRFPTAAVMARRLKDLLKAGLVRDTSGSETGSFTSPVADTEAAPRLPEIELVPLHTSWGSIRSKSPWIFGAAAMSLIVLAGIILRILFPPDPTGPPVPPTIREGQVYIEKGLVRLGNDEEKLSAFLTSYLLDSELKSALDIFRQEAQRRVEVGGFWIDQYEVTNVKYAEFIRETGREAPEHWHGTNLPSGKADHPVVNVSYDDAEAYAHWAGKELPTREQWLRAFRGDKDCLFPWGDTYEAGRANVGDNQKYPSTSRVKDTPRDVSPFQVYNLAGNAGEFIRGKYSHEGREWRVTKGADYSKWGYVWGIGSCQILYEPGLKSPRVGFRCVREEEEP